MMTDRQKEIIFWGVVLLVLITLWQPDYWQWLAGFLGIAIVLSAYLYTKGIKP